MDSSSSSFSLFVISRVLSISKPPYTTVLNFSSIFFYHIHYLSLIWFLSLLFLIFFLLIS
jgi:hypothetical protein